MDEPRDLLPAQPRSEERERLPRRRRLGARLDAHDPSGEAGEPLPAADRRRVPEVELPCKEDERRARRGGRRFPEREAPENLRPRVGPEARRQVEEWGAVLHRDGRPRLGERRFARRPPRRAPRHPGGRSSGGDEPLAGEGRELARDREAEQVEADPLPHLAGPGQVEKERIRGARPLGGPKDGGHHFRRARRQAVAEGLLEAPPRLAGPPARHVPSRQPERDGPQDGRRRKGPPGGHGRRREPGDVARPGPRAERLHALGGEAEGMGTEKGEEACEADEVRGVLRVGEVFRKGPRRRRGAGDPGAALPTAPGEGRESGVEEPDDLRRARGDVRPRNRPFRPPRGVPLRSSPFAQQLSEGPGNLRTLPRRGSIPALALRPAPRETSSRPRTPGTTSRRPRARRACSRPAA